MARDGYIRGYRKTLDNPIVCKDAEHFAIWHYLLYEARYKESVSLFGGKKITLKPGQLTTGRKQIAQHFGIDESKVQRVLKVFENEQMIEQQTSNKNRMITVNQWEQYQLCEQQNEQPVNNHCTTTEQPLNTPKESKKEIKKKINNIIPPRREWVKSYIAEKEYEVDVDTWFEFYQAKGWKVGREMMKDWQAAVRYWNAKRKGKANENSRADRSAKGRAESADPKDRSYDKFFK